MTSNCPGIICRDRACPCPFPGWASTRLAPTTLNHRGACFKHAPKFVNIRSPSTRRQTLQECLTVHLRSQPRIEDCQHSAIGRAANQTAEALVQTDDCLRHAVFMEARTALLFDIALARGYDRIARDREGKLVDNHARQLFAAHVHALPETRCGKQNRVRRAAKLAEQGALRRTALHKAWIIDFRRHAFEKIVHSRKAGG